MNLIFERTCECFPEQYDIKDADSGEMRAYFRLRWGRYSVTVPDVGGREILYGMPTDGTDMTGCFESDEERAIVLKAVEAAIVQYYMGPLSRAGKGD